jgi:hypothetical protein
MSNAETNDETHALLMELRTHATDGRVTVALGYDTFARRDELRVSYENKRGPRSMWIDPAPAALPTVLRALIEDAKRWAALNDPREAEIAAALHAFAADGVPGTVLWRMLAIDRLADRIVKFVREHGCFWAGGLIIERTSPSPRWPSGGWRARGNTAFIYGYGSDLERVVRRYAMGNHISALRHDLPPGTPETISVPDEERHNFIAIEEEQGA